MALNDVKVIRGGGQLISDFPVADRTTSSDTQILPGEPVGKLATGDNSVGHVPTGGPTNAVGTILSGIASVTSTETATADGVVNFVEVIPGKTVLRAKATTPANVSRDLIGDAVTLTYADGVYTVNEDEGDDPNVHGLYITDVNVEAGTIDFQVKAYATEQGSSY